MKTKKVAASSRNRVVKLPGWRVLAIRPPTTPPRPSPRFMPIRCSAKAECVRSAGVSLDSNVDCPGQKQAVPAPSSASSTNPCQTSRISGKSANEAAWSSSPNSSVFRPPKRSTIVPAPRPAASAATAPDESESVVAELTHEGQTGYGEGTPIERYYEDGASAVEFLHECRGALGGDPFALDDILGALPATPHTQAARAALDHALHDLCGKLTGLPVWRLLGLHRTGPPTCWTVWLGDPDDMARRAEAAAPRFQRLKLKLGGRDGLDLERG